MPGLPAIIQPQIPNLNPFQNYSPFKIDKTQ